MILDDKTRRYYSRLGVLLREATLKCSAASEDWNVRNDEFNDHYRRQYPDKILKNGKPSDPLHYVRGKKENLTLQDAENTWSHWEREVVRLSAAIEGGWALMQMMMLGRDDSGMPLHPTGMHRVAFVSEQEESGFDEIYQQRKADASQ